MPTSTPTAERRPATYMVVLTIIFGVASLATFFVKETHADNFFGAYNLLRLAVYILFFIFFLRTLPGVPRITPKGAPLPRWTRRLIIILPCVAVGFALINAFLPEVGQVVRMSQDNIFLRPGAIARTLMQLTALVVFATLIPRYLHRKQRLAVMLLIVLVFVTFVMAGEEVSWGQRIFQWQTSGYFASHNLQDETNLHNLATQLFQNLLFFGGFILLMVLPLLHDRLSALFAKTKALKPLITFLPESWMLPAFGAGLVFVDPLNTAYGTHWGSIACQSIGALILLGYVIRGLYRSGQAEWRNALWTLIAAVIVLTLSLSFDHLWRISQGLPTEYIKLYVSFGIMCWAIRSHQKVTELASN